MAQKPAQVSHLDFFFKKRKWRALMGSIGLSSCQVSRKSIEQFLRSDPGHKHGQTHRRTEPILRFHFVKNWSGILIWCLNIIVIFAQYWLHGQMYDFTVTSLRVILLILYQEFIITDDELLPLHIMHAVIKNKDMALCT